VSGGFARTALLLAAALLPLAGCATGGFELSKAEVDELAQTGATPAPNQPADPTRLSDETTIRNAVSAADPEASQVQPLAWANADTGSRGAISNLIEKQQDGTLCREFTASRESFDGVALYSGNACKGDRGAWYMRSFKPL
jgi:hypothetical protein